MDFTELFLSEIEDDASFNEALEIVRRNSQGRIWLIGGFVYRTLAHALYRTPRPPVDLDFIVEVPSSDFILPPGWSKKENRFGNPKLVNGNKEIDFVPLDSIHSISSRGLKPTIANYLSGVPLTVQSICFDMSTNSIVGDVGISALKKMEVAINNLEFAEYAAKKKGLALRAMIEKKAVSLGFTPLFN